MRKSSKRILFSASWRSPGGGAGLFARLSEHTCPARRRGMLSVKKSRQKNFGAEFVIAFGGAEILQGTKPVRLPGGGLLLYAQK